MSEQKLPLEMEIRRATHEDLEKIRSAALEGQNQQMLAWTYLLQEIMYIREDLERIEKALPGCNQEALRELIRDEVTQMFQSLASSDRTLEEYK